MESVGARIICLTWDSAAAVQVSTSNLPSTPSKLTAEVKVVEKLEDPA
jgi:hypothetical protein